MQQFEKNSFLDRLMIASPCSQSWDSMPGDDRVRHCNTCERNVYNISAMTNNEAEDFLRKHGNSQCMRFFRRTDGTILTDNCPVGLRSTRNGLRKLIKLAAGFMALLVGAPAAMGQSAQPEENHSFRQGKVIVRDDPPKSADPEIDHPERWASGGPMFSPPVGPTHPPATSVWGQPMPVGNHPTVYEAPSKPGAVKLNATMHADRKALDLLLEAQKNEAAGRDLVALCYYRKALSSIDARKGDPKFRSSVQAELEALQRKLGLNKPKP